MSEKITAIKSFFKKPLTWWITGGTLLLGGAVFGIVILAADPVPDPKKQKPEDRMNYLLSKDFANLSMKDKKRYLRDSRRNRDRNNPDRRNSFRNLSQEDRKKLREQVGPVFREMFRERRRESVNKYFACKTEEEKNAYLDDILNGMQKRRAEQEARRRNMTDAEKKAQEKRRAQRQAQGAQRANRGANPSRMTSRLDNSSPEDRAKATAFRNALRKRAAQRGITMRRGRGGRG